MDAQDVATPFDRAAATYNVAAFPFFSPFGEALVEFARIQPDERGFPPTYTALFTRAQQNA
jgi:hypothetical protein